MITKAFSLLLPLVMGFTTQSGFAPEPDAFADFFPHTYTASLAIPEIGEDVCVEIYSLESMSDEELETHIAISAQELLEDWSSGQGTA